MPFQYLFKVGDRVRLCNDYGGPREYPNWYSVRGLATQPDETYPKKGATGTVLVRGDDGESPYYGVQFDRSDYFSLPTPVFDLVPETIPESEPWSRVEFGPPINHIVCVSFEFSYGHRIIGHKGKCAHLHGHNAKVEVFVESEILNELGMVVDFGMLKQQCKSWVDQNLDHVMILQSTDPVLGSLQGSGETVCVVKFPPTAEILAEILLFKFKQIEPRVFRVRLWETSTSYAEVGGPS